MDHHSVASSLLLGRNGRNWESFRAESSALEEARELAVEALTLHMSGMIEDGEALPKPSTLDQLARDPAMKGAVAFLVSAEAPEKTVLVNITARESQIEAIDKLARKAGMTRSAYMVQSSVRGVGERRVVGRR
jgi:hypothetical protein